MKFRIKREELLNAISIVESALPTKTVIDSLKGIKIEVTTDAISFMASKQDLAICYTVDNKELFETYEEGNSILPGTYLTTIIKKTEDEFFNFEKKEKKTIVTTTNSKADIVEYDQSSYPKINFQKNNCTKIILDKEKFYKTYNQTKFSVSHSNVKPILTGINYKFDNNNLEVSSTDARRLSIVKTAVNSEVETSFTIYRGLLNSIIKIVDFSKKKDIELFCNDNQIIIESNNIILKARLLEGTYPNIIKLIPTKSIYSFEIESKNILNVLEKILLLSERDNGNVTIDIHESKILVKSYFKEIGAFEEYCIIENLKGTPFSISFDPKFMIDAIHSIEKEKVEIQLVDEISPFLIKSLDDNNNLQIISPIRMT